MKDDERPRIRSTCRLKDDLTLLTWEWEDLKIKTIHELIEDLKIDGVQDVTDLRAEIFYDQSQMDYVLAVSVPASARPEDW